MSDSPRTILDELARRLPTAKRTTLRRMLQAGRVRVNGRKVIRLNDPLPNHAMLEIWDQAAPTRSSKSRTPPFDILLEDDDVLVINKPPGLLTSTTPGEKRATLWAMVRGYLSETAPDATPGLIHRLDKDASGLLIFSKNHRTYQSLKKQFAAHTVSRIYTAVVEGMPPHPQGRIRNRLVELPDGSVRSTTAPGKGQPADTHYEMIKSSKGLSLLRVTLHTGRKHQIRAHLKELGTPILNDILYGKPNSGKRLMLVATELAFDHPETGQRIELKIPMCKTPF